jgi:Na+/melibiose symporter-like transporter
VHTDVAHAAIAGILILLTLWGLKAAGLRRDDRKWDWNVFIAVFIVMTVLNILWPFNST